MKKNKLLSKNRNKLILALLVVSLVTLVITLVYFEKTKESREQLETHAAGAGWLSGTSCNATDGGFAAWRGSPLTIAGTWGDQDAHAQRIQYSMGAEYGNWTESIDVAIGGFWGSSNWASVASGADDANLHAALDSIDKGWGSKKTVFIRFAHEFNGNWYNWKVSPADNENYKKAFARFHGMVQTDLVAKGRDAKVVWSPNRDEHNGVNTADSWPGDQYVDVVGVDYYDWDVASDQGKWDSLFNKTAANGGPAGIGAWQAFARAHGKPISFPEWGTTGGGPTDNPFFIQKMNEFFRVNAGTGPGQVWYEIYFDCTGYDQGKGENFLIYPENQSKIPQSAAMYKSLKWGNASTGGVTPGQGTQAPTQPQPTLITPTTVCGGSQYCVPTGEVTPTGVDSNPSVGPTSIDQNPSTNPDPSSSISQPPGGDSGGGGGGGSRNGEGLWQLIIRFLTMLIESFLGLFGRN